MGAHTEKGQIGHRRIHRAPSNQSSGAAGLDDGNGTKNDTQA
jgi:hypothetical protein